MGLQKRESPTARQLQSEETRKLLVDTAFTLFNTYSFESVGVRDIAKAAGVSTGAFYHHFKTKEEVIWAHVEEEKAWLSSLSPDDLNGDTFYEKFMDFVDRYLVKIIQNSGSEMIHQILNLKKTSAELYSVFMKLISGGQQSGEFSTEKSAEELCDFLLACYRGAAYDWYRRDGDADIGVLIHEHISYPLEHFLVK